MSRSEGLSFFEQLISIFELFSAASQRLCNASTQETVLHASAAPHVPSCPSCPVFLPMPHHRREERTHSWSGKISPFPKPGCYFGNTPICQKPLRLPLGMLMSPCASPNSLQFHSYIKITITPAFTVSAGCIGKHA